MHSVKHFWGQAHKTLLHVLLLYYINMSLSFLAIFNDFWRMQTTDYYCQLQNPIIFWGDDFFSTRGSKKSGAYDCAK
jgi:hypothetical protein